MKSDYCLNSCIKLKEKRISRHTSIPEQICFELNAEIVERIMASIKDYTHLELKSAQLADLRYYSLINSALEQNYYSFDSQSSLIFSSNYLLHNSQFQTTVIRSIINLNGQISQEIQQDLWQNRQVSFKVIQAHHWLTTEILRQLPLKNKSYSVFLFWTLYISLVFLFTGIFLYFAVIPLVSKILISLIGCHLLKILLQDLIYNHFRKLIIDNLIYGWLANKTYKRQLGFVLLSLVI